MNDYYALSTDTKSLVALARSLTRDNILLGEVDPIRLCNRLAARVEYLEGEVERLKRKADAGRPHSCG